MIKKMTFLLAACLVTGVFAAGEKTVLDIEPPKHLDRKGLFVLTPQKAREVKLKSVTTSDWLYEKDGRLTDRQRGADVEYDESGRLIRFAGNVDQKGYVELEYEYDKESRILEEKMFSKNGETRELAVRSVFDYGIPKSKEQLVYGRDGAMLARTRFSSDDVGRLTKIEKLDASSGNVLVEAKRTYDKNGNFEEGYGAAGRTTHTIENQVLAVSKFVGPATLMSNGKLVSVEQYTFDDGRNLLSFFRKSGDGSFWDRFAYKLNERGLPVEKVWSRLEYVLQDPYELTRYAYEFYP